MTQATDQESFNWLRLDREPLLEATGQLVYRLDADEMQAAFFQSTSSDVDVLSSCVCITSPLAMNCWLRAIVAENDEGRQSAYLIPWWSARPVGCDWLAPAHA